MSSHSSSIDSSSEVRDSLTPPLPDPTTTHLILPAGTTPPLPSDTTTPSTAGASTPIASTPVEAGNTGSIESKSSVAESGAAIRRGSSGASYSTTTSRRSIHSSSSNASHLSILSLSSIASSAAKASGKIDEKAQKSRSVERLVDFISDYGEYFFLGLAVFITIMNFMNSLLGERGTGECSVPIEAIYSEENTSVFNVTHNSTVTLEQVLHQIIEFNTTIYEPDCSPISVSDDTFIRDAMKLTVTSLLLVSDVLQRISVLVPWVRDLYQHFLLVHNVGKNHQFLDEHNTEYYKQSSIIAHRDEAFKIQKEFVKSEGFLSQLPQRAGEQGTLRRDIQASTEKITSDLERVKQKFDDVTSNQDSLLKEATGKKKWQERTKDHLVYLLGVAIETKDSKKAPVGHKVAPVTGEHKAESKDEIAPGASAGESKASLPLGLDPERGLTSSEGKWTHLVAPSFIKSPLFIKNVFLTTLFFLPNILEASSYKLDERHSNAYVIGYGLLLLPLVSRFVKWYYPIESETEQVKAIQEALVRWTRITNLFDPVSELGSRSQKFREASTSSTAIESVANEETQGDLKGLALTFSTALAESKPGSGAGAESDAGSVADAQKEPDESSPALG